MALERAASSGHKITGLPQVRASSNDLSEVDTLTSHVRSSNRKPAKFRNHISIAGLQQVERMIRPYVAGFRWQFKRPLLAWLHPEALAFYQDIVAHAFKPNELIDILAERRILYIAVPKAASTRIRATLSAAIGRDTITSRKIHNRRASGLRAPRHNVLDFYTVAMDPNALRFSFVRNPYDRLVSCWADQYRDKPLVAGDIYVDLYLKAKRELNDPLPEGADQTLPFTDFIQVVTANAERRLDMHWQLQSDILDVPGVAINHVGKIERFAEDFVRVLDHAGVKGELRRTAMQPFHSSKHGRTADYFTDALADRVYRAYERDFDGFGYARKLPG